jgi:riboflavin kinase / FMN adenylyltransferase
MQRWRGYEATPGGWGRSVVTIGVFDGVHTGHQATITHAVERARALKLPSLVLTFDPHPSEVVRPGSHPAMLTSPLRKAELIEDLGIDVLCVQPFTLDFSRVSAERFIHDILVEHLHAAVIVVGQNFRFGHKAAGDVGLLTELGHRFGYSVESAPLVSDNGTIYSSTYVRACVDAGDVTTAAEVLGRPHRVEGVVVRGYQRGRQLGFPTANVESPEFTAIPADGVYAGWMQGVPVGNLPAAYGGTRWPSAISVGTNPTFEGVPRTVEAYALDRDDLDLYGAHVAIEFGGRLRDNLRFDSIEALIAQIHADVDEVRRRT